MILVDANLLLYAQVETFEQHAAARRWLDDPAPTDRHREVLGRLLNDHAMPAEMIPDAHLAALALEHGLVVCSSDLGFGRFPEVRWENPLA